MKVTSALEVTYPPKHSINCIYVSVVGSTWLTTMCQSGSYSNIVHTGT